MSAHSTSRTPIKEPSRNAHSKRSHQTKKGTESFDIDNDARSSLNSGRLNTSDMTYQKQAILLEAEIAYIKEEIRALEDQLTLSKSKERRLRIENDILLEAIVNYTN
ncbi:hypothetical protein H4219_002987, partial [Mycoemilia scoparia]